MIIKITEKCMHDDSKEKYNGTRNYTYEVEGAKTLEEAIEDFTNNFSIDNVLIVTIVLRGVA